MRTTVGVDDEVAILVVATRSTDCIDEVLSELVDVLQVLQVFGF